MIRMMMMGISDGPPIKPGSIPEHNYKNHAKVLDVGYKFDKKKE